MVHTLTAITTEFTRLELYGTAAGILLLVGLLNFEAIWASRKARNAAKVSQRDLELLSLRIGQLHRRVTCLENSDRANTKAIGALFDVAESIRSSLIQQYKDLGGEDIIDEEGNPAP